MMAGQEIRYALRQLLRNPAFTAAAVLTLALGIGANTAVFSVARSVFLQPLPYRNGERLVHLGCQPTPSGMVTTAFAVQDFLDYSRQNQTFTGLAEYHSIAFNLLDPEGEPDRVRTGVVSANFFEVFGVSPLLGRTFRKDDEQPGAPAVLLLSFEYWRRRFGEDPGIVGKTLTMNGGPITVVGVLPRLPPYPGEDDVFMPTSACPFRSSVKVTENRNVRLLNLFGHLDPGVTQEQAQADLSTIAARLFRDHPDSHLGDPRQEVALLALREELTGEFKPVLLLLLATVGLILLVACTNVANLLLARMVSRERELALHVALGADRGRLVRQLLTESLLLSLMGGALGVALAIPALGLLRAFASRSTPRAEEISMDGPVLFFTFAVSLATGLAFGLLPALRAVRKDPVCGLKAGEGPTMAGRGGTRLRSVLVVTQVAISVVLLITAGLMVRSVVRLEQVDAGFESEGVLTASIELPGSKYKRQAAMTFYELLLERLASAPGVVSASLVTDIPMEGDLVLRNFTIEGRPPVSGEAQPQAEFHIVSRDYFRTLRIPLLAGRMFERSDGPLSLPVVMVNRAMANRYWPGQDPIGRRIGNLIPNRDHLWTIVGVVGDVKQLGLDVESGPAYYLSSVQEPSRDMRLVVRAAAEPANLAPVIRKAVREIDAEQAVADVVTLAQLRRESIESPRLSAILLSVFALLAFAIAAVGVAGLMAYSVSQRRKEIGLRIALGAERERVLGLVLLQGLALILPGLVLGLVAALSLSRLWSSLLFGVPPTDPLTFIVVSFGLLAAGVLACFGPARRATAVDPAKVLRS